MSTRLVLLGLLRRGPLHGYELKHIIEERMGDWTNIAFGSIYFALRKLREEGFTAEQSTDRAGRRPAKTVYAITDAGHEEFLKLLRAVLMERERRYYEIDVALAFLDALDAQEAVSLFRGRLAALVQAEAYLRNHETAQMDRPEVPRSARAIFTHSLLHLRAEVDWTREVLADLESGSLSRGFM